MAMLMVPTDHIAYRSPSNATTLDNTARDYGSMDLTS